MAVAPGGEDLEAFVEVRCECGYPHTLLRSEVLEGLCVRRWRCAACKRRFVVACTPGGEGRPDEFWPIFLDQVPSRGSTVEDGVSASAVDPEVMPARIHFRCRCSCRLAGRPGMLGRPCRCPRCGARIILRVAPGEGTRVPVPILEFLDGDETA